MAIQLLDTARNEIPVKFTQFSGGERHVQIDETTLGSLYGNVLVRAHGLKSRCDGLFTT